MVQFDALPHRALALDTPGLRLTGHGNGQRADEMTWRAGSPTSGRSLEPALSPPPGVNVFALASRPQSDRTVYLDFTGGALVAESGWINNGQPKDALPYPAYSIDADPAFSSEEQARIYAAWDAVAEDFALFDVNVTTQRPPMSDLVRADGNDARFGVHALISPMGTPAHQRICEGWCTGMGFVNGITYKIAATTTREALPEPVWVFANSGFSGSGIGDAVSHEVGHTLGLKHDGYDDADYFGGTYFWAPIMGSNDGSAVVTQWSNGTYPHANNFEDDLFIIGRWFTALPDDLPGLEAPTQVQGSATGVINSNEDADAFTVNAPHKTTITVTPTAATPNVDLTMTVYASDGRRLEHLDFQPATDLGKRGHLSAAWTGKAPTGQSVTVVVQGTGLSTNAGSYTDYGSIGRYRLDAVEAPTTLRWDGPIKPKGLRVGRTTKATWKVRGIEGNALVSLTRTGSKPRGVRVVVDKSRNVVQLSGVPRRAGTYALTFTATDTYGAQAIKVTLKIKKPKRHTASKGHKGHKGDKGDKGDSGTRS